MHRFGIVIGLLLAALGLAGAVTVMLGAVGGPGAYPPVEPAYSGAPLAIAAGIALASGLTLLGLNAGHWQSPVPPGPELDRTPDQQSPGSMR